MKKAMLVTGGTVGTGLACAHRFASEGYAVLITSRDGMRAEKAAREVAETHGVFARGYELAVGNEQAVIDLFCEERPFCRNRDSQFRQYGLWE